MKTQSQNRVLSRFLDRLRLLKQPRRTLFLSVRNLKATDQKMQQPVIDDATAPDNATDDLLDPDATTLTDAGKQKQPAAPMAKRGRDRPRKDGGMNVTDEKEKADNVPPSDQSIAHPRKTYELSPRPKRTDIFNYYSSLS